MNANLSQQLTLLGLAAMAFYALLLATGTVGLDVMPQFMVSAIIFLSSGRLMRQAARNLPKKDVPENPPRKKIALDWDWLSQFLNWFMAVLILGALALWVMKPVGVSFVDALSQYQPASHSYYSDSIP